MSTSTAKANENGFIHDPCRSAIEFWMHESKLALVSMSKWEYGVTDMITKYVEIKGAYNHSNIKQMIAIAKWAKAWNEYQIQRSLVIQEWQSEKK